MLSRTELACIVYCTNSPKEQLPAVKRSAQYHDGIRLLWRDTMKVSAYCGSPGVGIAVGRGRKLGCGWIWDTIWETPAISPPCSKAERQEHNRAGGWGRLRSTYVEGPPLPGKGRLGRCSTPLDAAEAKFVHAPRACVFGGRECRLSRAVPEGSSVAHGKSRHTQLVCIMGTGFLAVSRPPRVTLTLLRTR